MIKEAKKKANELIQLYKPMVRIDHTYDKMPIVEYAIKCAIISFEQIIQDIKGNRMKYWLTVQQSIDASKFWMFVLDELNEKIST